MKKLHFMRILALLLALCLVLPGCAKDESKPTDPSTQATDPSTEATEPSSEVTEPSGNPFDEPMQTLNYRGLEFPLPAYFQLDSEGLNYYVYDGDTVTVTVSCAPVDTILESDIDTAHELAQSYVEALCDEHTTASICQADTGVWVVLAESGRYDYKMASGFYVYSGMGWIITAESLFEWVDSAEELAKFVVYGTVIPEEVEQFTSGTFG